MKYLLAVVIILVLVLSCAKHEVTVEDVVSLAREAGMSDSLLIEYEKCLRESPQDTAKQREILFKDQQERRKGAEDD